MYAVLDRDIHGKKNAAQCFDVASENAMTPMFFFLQERFRLVCVSRLSVECLGSDTMTLLLCQAQDRNASKHIASLGPCRALGNAHDRARRERIEHEATHDTRN